MSRRRLFELLLVRWGFALLVAISIAIGFIAAVTVAVPTDLPSVALQTAVIYRVEVGAAVFFGLYIAALALVLAMHNRGFTELGTGGVRAQGVAAVEDAEFEELVSELIDEVRSLQDWRMEREIGKR